MNNIVNKLGGSGSSSGHTQQPMGQKDDYGDKGELSSAHETRPPSPC